MIEMRPVLDLTNHLESVSQNLYSVNKPELKK